MKYKVNMNHLGWYNRAVSSYRLGNFSDAIYCLENAIIANYYNHHLWKDYGDWLREKGHMNEAICSYIQAIIVKELMEN
jgi:tetratricopeptide (TPR) repeat protein